MGSDAYESLNGTYVLETLEREELDAENVKYDAYIHAVNAPHVHVSQVNVVEECERNDHTVWPNKSEAQFVKQLVEFPCGLGLNGSGDVRNMCYGLEVNRMGYNGCRGLDDTTLRKLGADNRAHTGTVNETKLNHTIKTS